MSVLDVPEAALEEPALLANDIKEFFADPGATSGPHSAAVAPEQPGHGPG